MSVAVGPAIPVNYKPPSTPALSSVRRSGVVVYAWGRGDMGQLAMPSDSFIPRPVRVEALSGKDIVHIACSAFNSIFITEDGEVYTSGNNDCGQLGAKVKGQNSTENGMPTENSWQPVRVNALDLYKIQHAACGQSHMLAITEHGLAASWGASEFGQLGQGGESLSQSIPRIVKGAKDARFSRCASGACHSAVLATNGKVYTFGQGNFGALGHGDEDNRDAPVLVSPLWPVGITMVSCGENHTAALALDGRLFTWGRGKYGQLGLGDFKGQLSPEPVKALLGSRLVQVACGGDHTLALTSEGAVYSWGRGAHGQCGAGTPDNTCRPGRLQGLGDQRTLQVSAGLRHSVVLTANNEVYSFGDGEQGQLGTGHLASQLVPKKVDGLPDLPVLFVAAGGDHTMVVLKEVQPGEKVAVGPASSRAYGRGHAAMQPLPMLLQMCANISSAATGVGGEGVAAESRAAIHALATAVDDLFSSPGFLTAGFSMPLNSTPGATEGSKAAAAAAAGPAMSPKAAAAQMPAAGTGAAAARSLGAAALSGLSKSQDSLPWVDHNVDVMAVQAVYQALLKVFDSEVVAALGSSCNRLLEQVQQQQQQQQQKAAAKQLGQATAAAAAAAADSAMLEWLMPLLLILFLNPLNGEPLSICLSLTSNLIQCTLDLPRPAQQLLARWLADLPAEVFGGRVVRPMQRYLTGLANPGLRAKRESIMQAAQLLDLLFDANERVGSPIPLSEFHNTAVSEAADLREEYLAFAELRNRRVVQGAKLPVSLCQVPFLLTPTAKSGILQGEASVQKQHMVQSSAMSALLQGLDPSMLAFLDIQVRRSQILQDSLQQIVNRPQDLKKPLRVRFVSNGVPEEGIDEGGVSREFFQLLVAEIFKPDYGMFVYSEETRNFWFNLSSLESSVEFQLVGIILGLAIYNGVILDVHFPLVVYKKLLGQRPGFGDLAEVQPALARGLKQLLEFEGDVEGTFCRMFEVEYEYYGVTRRHELMPGGASLPVTASNRQQYVTLYTEWLLSGSISKQFEAFAHGFHQVCGGLALSMFRHEELELLVCGLPHLDFGELEKNAKYEGGFHASHPTIQAFWQVVQAFNIDQKRRFLSFATGCPRAPVGGLGQLTLVVQRMGPDTDRLPTSHTCFNSLLLPDYSSKDKMRERLLLAIENAQGFGLK